MEIKRLQAPIPGESLTESPRSMPYERPPEIVDPEEAIQMHITRLTDEEKMGAIIDAVELGVDIKTLTTGLLRSAVANGIHTVDVSLLIAPVIHEYIKGVADDAGLDYKEGFVNEKEQERKRRQIQYAKARKKLKEGGYAEEAEEPQGDIQMDGEALPTDTGEKPRGIMQRRMKQ